MALIASIGPLNLSFSPYSLPHPPVEVDFRSRSELSMPWIQAFVDLEVSDSAGLLNTEGEGPAGLQGCHSVEAFLEDASSLFFQTLFLKESEHC